MWIFWNVFSLTFLLSSASVEITVPEFECIALEIKDRNAASEILGVDQYPSVGLRKFASGAWQLRIGISSSVLNASRVKKIEHLITTGVSYEIQYHDSRFRFDLNGTPPSRQGLLWSANAPPMESKILARVTCH